MGNLIENQGDSGMMPSYGHSTKLISRGAQTAVVLAVGMALLMLRAGPASAGVPPANDDFDHATTITAVPFTDRVDVSGATAAADDPASCSPTNNSLWYAFTPAVNETVTIDALGGSNYAFVSAYTGARGALAQVACGDFSGFPLAASWLASAGVTYHIMVAGAPGGTGTVQLNVKASLPPANDDFDNATVIMSVPFSETVDTTGATTAADDPTSCSPTSNSVWYALTPAATESVTLTASSSTGSAFASAYTGARGSLDQVACGDNSGFSMPAKWLATAGVTYHIMVAGAPGGMTQLTVSASSPPVNDDFDHATTITSVPFRATVDVSGATGAADDPTTCSPTNNSVWFALTPAVNETVTVDTFGGSSSAFASAYTGARGALVQVACGDFGGFPLAASWLATAGVTYHIMVATPDLVASAVQLNVAAAAVGRAPTITSPGTATFVVGANGAFTVTTTGSPPPALTAMGTPPGLGFTDNGDGTASLAGTPITAGTFALMVRAHNGVGTDASQALTVIIDRASSTTNVSASPLNPAFGNPVAMMATVSPAAPNAFGPTGTVSFFIDNQSGPVATVPLAGATASFTTAGLGAGPHSAVVTYSGDADFAASTSAPASFIVTASRTITGTYDNALIVGPGSTVLLRGANLRGPVLVSPGGALDVENSTVSGAVVATQPLAVRVCATTVNGAVSITGATGFVLVGDSVDDSCGPNTIRGSVILRNNTKGLEAIGNHVAGLVISSGNAGTGAFPEDTAPEISGNDR